MRLLKAKVANDVAMYVMVGLLVYGAYMLGSYKARINYLGGNVVGSKTKIVGNNGSDSAGADAKNNDNGQDQVVLSDEQWKKILENPTAVKGKDDAPVVIVEFTDYQCPFCGKYFSSSYSQLMKDYVDTGKVKYVVRDFPLNFHQNAESAAVAVRCAGKEGKYWEMHDVVFKNQSEWSEAGDPSELFAKYGDGIGVNIRSCQNDSSVKKAVRDDFNLGQSVGVRGTPTFYVNGKQLVGAQPYAVFKSMIDNELSGK